LTFGYVIWGQAVAGAGARNEAVAGWEQAVQAGAEHAEVANAVAWFLATTCEPPIRDPVKAVGLAKKAVDSAPQNGDFWHTLGAAYYGAGQWQQAVAALEKSIQLRSGGSSGDWFFLAMVCQQLGDAGKARHWYDKAVQWMDKNRPHDDELRRFRKEAAALLGVEQEPLKAQSDISKHRSAERTATP
jgi:uncharacterized protein HemY